MAAAAPNTLGACVAAERRSLRPWAQPRLELGAAGVAQPVSTLPARGYAHALAQPFYLALRVLDAYVPVLDDEVAARIGDPIAPYLLAHHLRRPAYRPRYPGNRVAPFEPSLYREPVVVRERPPRPLLLAHRSSFLIGLRVKRRRPPKGHPMRVLFRNYERLEVEGVLPRIQMSSAPRYENTHLSWADAVFLRYAASL